MSHESASIPIHFALSPDEPPLTSESDRWSDPLPASRSAFGPSHNDAGFDVHTTYGDYFTATRNFLTQDNFALICQTTGQLLDKAVSWEDIKSISIYLVKHGAFYHPACVTVDVFGQNLNLVLNVAVAIQGQKIIIQEYRSISALTAELGAPFWPQIFGIGQGEDLKGRQFPMFLGQWLDNYHEFHLTGEAPDPRQVVVWDSDHGHRMLTESQTKTCLEQAAAILSYAYNPLTTEAVGNWHHGAGDFVINLAKERFSLQLITIRNYAPLIKDAQPDVAFILEALMVYLMQISLRLRLDRLDGIGDLVCHGIEVVPAICRGFFQGLQGGAPLRGLPDDFDATVKEFISLHGADKMMPIASALLEKAPFNPEERDLFIPILQSHVSALIEALAG